MERTDELQEEIYISTPKNNIKNNRKIREEIIVENEIEDEHEFQVVV